MGDGGEGVRQREWTATPVKESSSGDWTTMDRGGSGMEEVGGKEDRFYGVS